jgi:WD40-like Beta Propeller Repeat
MRRTTMSKLDDHLRRELRRAAPVPPTDDVFDRLALRFRRRRIVRKAGTAALAVVVLVGTAAGFLALDRAFRGGPAPAVEGSTNGSVVGVVRDTMRTSHLVLYPADGSAPVDLTPPHQGTDQDPAVSPDGRSLAFIHTPVSLGAADSSLRILDLTTGETRDLVNGQIREPAWSPDGKELVVVGTVDPSVHVPMGQPVTGLVLVAIDGSVLPRRVPLENEASGTIPWAEHPTWSLDGTKIAFEGGDTPEEGGPGVFIADVRTGEWHGTKLISTNGDVVAKPTWSPDGSWIALVGDATMRIDDATHDLILVSPDSSETRSAYGDVPIDQRPVVDSLGWSPDGHALVFSAANGRIYTQPIGGTPTEIGVGSEPTWLPAVDFVPQPQPDPSGSPSSDETGTDIGLDFRLCHVERLGGVDLLGEGISGTAWTGAKVRKDGTCPGAFDTPFVVALDHTGDGRADGYDQYSIPSCVDCRPFGTTDINADGHEELVVLLQSGTEAQYLLMQADIREGGVWFGPVFVTGPGDPDWGFDSDDTFTFWAGGDEGRSEFVECVGTHPTILVLTQRRTPIDGNSIAIHETRVQLSDGGDGATVVGTDETSVRSGDPIPSENTGPTCGGLDFNPAA